MIFDIIKIKKDVRVMNKRIEKLEKLTLDGKMLVEPIKTNFDRMDLFLDSQERDVKRIC